MNDFPRQQLCLLIAQHGRSLCDDSLRCEGLLRDVCGDYRKEVFVLVCALKEGVVRALLNSYSAGAIEIQLSRLTDQLYNNLALTRDAARWAVDSWALAAGLIDSQAIQRSTQKTTQINIITQQLPNNTQDDTPTQKVSMSNYEWGKNSYAIFEKIIAMSPKPFRAMTEIKLMETLSGRVGNRGVVTEGILIECALEISPKPFKAMLLKSIEPLITT
jgi:hypothetical protein